jgi:choline dehydrogenase-like flavoprotein
VADTSVMPDGVRANTNATPIMFAERMAAERMADVIRQGM